MPLSLSVLGCIWVALGGGPKCCRVKAWRYCESLAGWEHSAKLHGSVLLLIS